MCQRSRGCGIFHHYLSGSWHLLTGICSVNLFLKNFLPQNNLIGVFQGRMVKGRNMQNVFKIEGYSV